MTHSIHKNDACHAQESIMPQLWISQVKNLNESSSEYNSLRTHVKMSTGWRRSIGYRKLQVIFRRKAANNQIGESIQIGECFHIGECIQVLPYFNTPHYCSPMQWARGNCALKRSVAARPGLFCRKWPITIRHIMCLCHPVVSHAWKSHVVSTIRWRHTYERFMSHIRMSHAINAICFRHTYEWVTSCFRHTYEWVTSHAWVSQVVGTIRFRHTYEWVMSHIRMSHVLKEICFRHIYEWVISCIKWNPLRTHARMSEVSRLIYLCTEWNRMSHALI